MLQRGEEDRAMKKLQQCVSLLLLCVSHWLVIGVVDGANKSSSDEYASAVGDPGMRRDELRVALEAWNFCNEVGAEAPGMGSPRAADCFDIIDGSIHHKVNASDNKLGVGMHFPGLSMRDQNNVDIYAARKEERLGSLCEVSDTPTPWQFWMIMLKNGNFDTQSALCPLDGKNVGPFSEPGRFPCFGKGCMNQPTVNHQETRLLDDGTMIGGFNGTYDLGSDVAAGLDGISFYEVVWQKKQGEGSWVFHHTLKTSKKYPWLMLYLRADATKGFSGGYHYDTRGMLKTLPEGPNFKVKLTLDIKKGGGPKSQFYLIDIGSCWKNNGQPCDGYVTTDVTRYTEMIINPDTPAWCSATAQGNCPPYHITPDDRKIYKNDTANFPYGAYHYYCAPGNAKYMAKDNKGCDPYSNPQAQEIVQLLPHPIWGEYGYPTKKGQGWIGDARTWELDVGGLSSRMYYYQDPGTTPARRIWTSLDVGTEIFVSKKDEVAEWTLSNFDVIFTPPQTK